MNLDIKQYLESGIIEDYCFGVLSESETQEVLLIANTFPEIQQAIFDTQNTVEKLAQSLSKQPPVELKEKLLSVMENLQLEESISIDNLPLISKYSNSKLWLDFAKPLLPADTMEDIHLQVLKDDSNIFLTIIWTKTDIPSEVHENEKESFLILEGECECFVGDKRYILGPGDFFEVPMYMDHDVKLLTPSVVAILQRVAA